jgi:hypothetical protein
MRPFSQVFAAHQKAIPYNDYLDEEAFAVVRRWPRQFGEEGHQEGHHNRAPVPESPTEAD